MVATHTKCLSLKGAAGLAAAKSQPAGFPAGIALCFETVRNTSGAQDGVQQHAIDKDKMRSSEFDNGVRRGKNTRVMENRSSE
jgi:hypothetical protein